MLIKIATQNNDSSIIRYEAVLVNVHVLLGT